MAARSSHEGQRGSHFPLPQADPSPSSSLPNPRSQPGAQETSRAIHTAELATRVPLFREGAGFRAMSLSVSCREKQSLPDPYSGRWMPPRGLAGIGFWRTAQVSGLSEPIRRSPLWGFILVLGSNSASSPLRPLKDPGFFCAQTTRTPLLMPPATCPEGHSSDSLSSVCLHVAWGACSSRPPSDHQGNSVYTQGSRPLPQRHRPCRSGEVPWNPYLHKVWSSRLFAQNWLPVPHLGRYGGTGKLAPRSSRPKAGEAMTNRWATSLLPRVT